MSRSDYTDDMEDNWRSIIWRGAVKAAMRGRRGQAFLKEMLAALDALPEKKLITNELEDKTGAVCAIGAVGKARGIDMKDIDPDCPEQIAERFGIAPAMVRELVWMNDEWCDSYICHTPEARFIQMRNEIAKNIRPETSGLGAAGTAER